MLRLHSSKTKIDTLFLVSLFVLFAFTSSILVLLGAKQYHTTADTMNQNYEVRTAFSYFSEKIHQNDHAAIALTDFDGTQALVFTEETDGIAYRTYVYVYDDMLCELLVGSGTDATPSMGQSIVPMRALSMELSDEGLLTMNFTDTKDISHTRYLYVHTASQKEVS